MVHVIPYSYHFRPDQPSKKPQKTLGQIEAASNMATFFTLPQLFEMMSFSKKNAIILNMKTCVKLNRIEIFMF